MAVVFHNPGISFNPGVHVGGVYPVACSVQYAAMWPSSAELHDITLCTFLT